MESETRIAIEGLVKQLESYDLRNREKQLYYEGRRRIKDLGIAIPPRLQAIDAVVGWPGTAVDVMDERLDLETITGPEQYRDFLSRWFMRNNLGTESTLAHLDALIFGVGFICTGPGGPDEPEVLTTIESPMRMTAEHDPRTRRLKSALAVNRDSDGRVKSGTHYGLYRNTYFDAAFGGYRKTGEFEHGLGRVTVARLINRPRSSRMDGRSEITRAVRSLTDSAMRTLLGAEVVREFYSAPQRYAIATSEKAFTDTDGNPLNPWAVAIGRLLEVPYNNEDGDERGVMPQVGQFPANSPDPYFNQIRLYAQLFAAETAIPSNELGFVHDNPASADAIRAAEARLVKRAERRQKAFGAAWVEAAQVALMLNEGVKALPEGAELVTPKWRPAGTPTEAATADAGAKKIASLNLGGDSELAWELVGLTEDQKILARRDALNRRAQELAANLGVAAAAAAQNTQVAELVGERGSGAA